MWSNFIQYYKDPILVARIQEYFGIEIHYNKDDSNKRSTNKPESEISSTSEKNGLGDVKLSSSANGYYNQESESVTRQRHKDAVPSSNDASSDDIEPFTVKNHFWYYLFIFGTILGDDIFYSTFIPLWLWNVDGVSGRRIILVWSIVMATGQILKDVICWPRPSCPPAVRLQNKWSLEYGMPSTHAMIAVAIPFSVVLFTKDRYIYSFSAGFAVAIVWCSLICVSRLYLGMHTVLDVLAGLALAIGILIILVPVADVIDDFFVTNNWAILALLIISVAVVVYYPTSNKWTPTREDTTLVLATNAGIHLGYWINYKTGSLTAPLIPPPYNLTWPTYQAIGKMFSRTLLGFTYMLILGTLTKSLVYFIMCAILKVNSKELEKSENSLENKNKILVRLVYKYIFGFVITSSITTLLPKIFTMIGIERSTFYTEL